MPQRNFGRQVARAAASGGGKAYRSRPAVGWYVTMLLIVVVGVSLVVYSRQEAIHPKTTPAKSAEGPTASDDWHAALSIDICGKIETLPANPNLSSTGLRTFGDGLIYIQPGIVGSSKASKYEGENANLLTFASNYPKLTLTAFSIKLPNQKLYENGDHCTAVPKTATAAQKEAVSGTMEMETWSSPTAKGKMLTVPDPVTVHLTNGEMISVGFLTPGEKLPVPASKAALEALLPTPKSVTSTTTAPKSTTTTKPAASPTTTT